MISTAELSELLADLYAAPLEPQRWQSFIDRLCTLTDSAAGYMLSSNAMEGNVVLAGGGNNFDPEVIRLYNAHYGATDPYQAPFLARPRAQLIHGEELVNHDDLLRTELYNDVLLRYDLEFLSLVCYHFNDGEIDLLPMWHSSRHGRIDTTGSHLLASLIPHLRTAISLRKRLVASDAALIFSEATLDAMSIAAFLVNGKGQIRHMNRLASTHLEEGAVCVWIRQG